MPSTSTNSYSFNTTDFTITQCHLEDEKFSKVFASVITW